MSLSSYLLATMSRVSLPDSWKTQKFRESVIAKFDEELEEYKLKQAKPGQSVENAIYEKAKTKQQYLGYVAKIILSIRNMVCIQDAWLQNHVKEVLSKPPPKVRRVLSPEEMARYTKDLALLRSKIEQQTRLKVKQ